MAVQRAEDDDVTESRMSIPTMVSTTSIPNLGLSDARASFAARRTIGKSNRPIGGMKNFKSELPTLVEEKVDLQTSNCVQFELNCTPGK